MTDAGRPHDEARRRASWHFVTGEYPPQTGGVSDYCHSLATALAAAGDEVHVWAPPSSPGPESTGGVLVHRLPDRFGSAGLRELHSGLDACPPPRRIFVQHVSGAFGRRAMNLPFCLAIHARRRRDRVWILFHEYAYRAGWRQRPAVNLLGMVTPVLSAVLGASAQRIFVSTPAWIPRIPSFIRRSRPITWLPVPSNVPDSVDRARVAEVRGAVLGDGQETLIGHFGTFGPLIAAMLARILPDLLLDHPGRRCLLVGRGGEAFATRLIGEFPGLEGRLTTTGGLPAFDIAPYIAACDVMIQPFDDGATSRRSSLMACLAIGAAVVTNLGPSSEPLWAESKAVALASDTNPSSIVAQAERLLTEPARWEDLRRRTRDLYRSRFSFDRLLETVRGLAEEDDAR